MREALPSLICIGAEKFDTVSLYDVLIQYSKKAYLSQIKLLELLLGISFGYLV